ncbi:hypothetical protein [Streptomyces davaonensis]|uniref:hypothetical protein n=1 Tax=Streptomyces davaonensis TaxID=348043 RepID=UPI000349347C|nr:hypothetical protein [Streptomyces davaonensis]
MAAILLLPGLALAGFVAMIAIWVLSDDDLFESGPKPVPCVDVLHFGGAELPDGAEMVGECEEQGFQDLYYSARFRMPRADVEEWLALTYPFAPLPETDGCGVHDADLCLTAEDPAGHPDAGAQVVRVSVEYEDAATALVRFSAHTL